MIIIEGRSVYVRTGTGSQTVNICCPDNRAGKYEQVWRFKPPYCSPNDEMERQLDARCFQTLLQLREWLQHNGASRDPTRESKCDDVSPSDPPQFDLQSMIDAIVHRRFLDFGPDARGKNYKSRDHFIKFCTLLSQDSAKAESLITCLLTDVFMKLRLSADSTTPGPGERGLLRQEIGLSKERVQEIKAGKRLEEILERLIAELMSAADTHGQWFNQFNVAGGFYSRSAKYLDLVRRPRLHPERLEFIELKAWPKADHPFAAALQVFVYASISVILSTMGRDRPDIDWPSFGVLRMGVAAPTDWYREYDRDGDVSSVLKCFERAVANLPRCLWEPFDVRLEFHGEGIKINLAKDDFVSLFVSIADCNYGSVGQALTADVCQQLTECFRDAFAPWTIERRT